MFHSYIHVPLSFSPPPRLLLSKSNISLGKDLKKRNTQRASMIKKKKRVSRTYDNLDI